MLSPESTLSDGCIIDRVLSGKRDQFDVIVRRYHGPLMKLAFGKLGRIDWAEEVIQETFFHAYKSLHTYDSQYSFRTWLWTISINQCRRHGKKRQRRDELGGTGGVASTASTDRLELVECTDPGPQEQLRSQERSELLESLMARIPEVQADALRLRFFGGLKFHEIADVMSCALSTAKHRVRVGLQAMSRELIDLGLDDESLIDLSNPEKSTPSRELHP